MVSGKSLSDIPYLCNVIVETSKFISLDTLVAGWLYHHLLQAFETKK